MSKTTSSNASRMARHSFTGRNPYIYLDLIASIRANSDLSVPRTKELLKEVGMNVFTLAKKWTLFNPANWWKMSEIQDARSAYPIVKLDLLQDGIVLPDLFLTN